MSDACREPGDPVMGVAIADQADLLNRARKVILALREHFPGADEGIAAALEALESGKYPASLTELRDEVRALTAWLHEAEEARDLVTVRALAADLAVVSALLAAHLQRRAR